MLGALHSLIGPHVWVRTQTFAGSTDSVTFSSLPQNADHIRMFWLGHINSSSNRNIAIQFNGDTGNNYSASGVWHRANSTTINAWGGINRTDAIVNRMNDNTAIANYGIGGWLNIFDYTSTDTWKQAHGNMYDRQAGGDANLRLEHIFVEWQDTSAITSVKFFNTTSSDNFVANTRVALVGYRDAASLRPAPGL